MDRHEKVNNIKKLDDIIKHCDDKIAEYQSKIAEIESIKEEKKQELEKAKSAKSELVVFLGSRRSNRNGVSPIDIYYAADFGNLRTSVDTSKRATADVDLGNFLYSFTHAKNKSYYEIIFYTAAAFEMLLNDMFTKKTYNSWNEVKEDLLKINELYDAPKMNEGFTAYKKRILGKNNKVD